MAVGAGRGRPTDFRTTTNPQGTTFEFLRDRELELLCFGPYTVTLHFDGGIQIQIEGSFTHTKGVPCDAQGIALSVVQFAAYATAAAASNPSWDKTKWHADSWIW
jgi:hypothetical protein